MVPPLSLSLSVPSVHLTAHRFVLWWWTDSGEVSSKEHLTVLQKPLWLLNNLPFSFWSLLVHPSHVA